MNHVHSGKYLQILLVALACLSTAVANDQFKDIEIMTIQAGDGVYMLTGKGGNLGISIGDETYGAGFIKNEKFVEMLYQDLSR